MKPIKTKRQLLIVICVVSTIVFSIVAAVCWYLFDLQFVGPLMGTAAVFAFIQYNIRKNQLPEA